MKRKYKKTQQRVDEAIFSAIKNGVTSNAELKQVLMDGWQGYNVGELVDCFARNELAAAKQRLRNGGHIEITKGNEPKPAADLTPDDAEFIDQRRAAHIAGELKTRIEFNHRHGRIEAATEAAKQLALFAIEEETLVEDSVPA